MQDLLLKRTVQERIFKRLSKTINSLLENAFTSSKIIKNRLKEFERQWSRIQEAHGTYVVYCLSDLDEIKEQDTYIEQISEEFYFAESKCDSQENTQQSKQGSTENCIKIQRLKFPTFDGHMRKYAKFRYEFNKFAKPMCSTNQL